ncbi:hypothetical protein [Thermophagus xiamenensis]|uniref:Uncharacterized protein n=1 Tax=Thermophagus xiamenensis TaxID=385682 RepID=A0A1I1W0I3_9BACT|nr:hypothetical protein [Thermophagus xiamenensis]SFD87878.1 hypothetical protein SAMN05444380_103127 [Thermophagus xiamenensis]
MVATARTNVKAYYVEVKEGSFEDQFIKKYNQTTSKESSNIPRSNKIKIYPDIEFQTLEGVGGAFNEIGGEALMFLSPNRKKK